ncbi:MAG TPA: BlaI/MecI/CopY family transcriptional regulator [Gemmatimonadaceae bacterium]|nr:BlaI/MecI/CopY family transcriptional regulator [Gemmatimonadaceae bacterium]
MAPPLSELGRRERQIMDIIMRTGRATAQEVRAELADPPSYSAVRGMLRLLEDKGYIRHDWEGPRHVYRPAADPEVIKRSATRDFLRTFFNDSMESAVAAMLGVRQTPLSKEEIERLTRLIEQARNPRGRK